MSFIATAIVGSAAIGAGASIYGASKQYDAAAQARQTLESTFGRGIGEIKNLVTPFTDIASSVGPTLKDLLTPGRNMTDVLSQIPGFQFAQDWGQKAVTAQGTTRGLGGNVLAGGAQYATGLASNTYGQIVNALQALFGTGAGAATSAGSAIGELTGTMGQGIAQTQIGQGNALAAGTTGVANAFSGGLNSYAQLKFLDNLSGGTLLGNRGMYGLQQPNPYGAVPYGANSYANIQNPNAWAGIA